MIDNTGRDSKRTRVGHIRKDDCDVYVGRGEDTDMLNTPIGERGWLGNPFTVDQWGRGPAIGNFRRVFEWRIETDPEFRRAVADLSEKVLGCWCQRLEDDGPGCHAEIIADHANQISRSNPDA
jgi:hypothetical protein